MDLWMAVNTEAENIQKRTTRTCTMGSWTRRDVVRSDLNQFTHNRWYIGWLHLHTQEQSKYFYPKVSLGNRPFLTTAKQLLTDWRRAREGRDRTSDQQKTSKECSERSPCIIGPSVSLQLCIHFACSFPNRRCLPIMFSFLLKELHTYIDTYMHFFVLRAGLVKKANHH